MRLSSWKRRGTQFLEQGWSRLPAPADDAPLHEVDTSDGWRLLIAEYGVGNTGPVVYLQHGLAASHLAFDIHPHGFSPARFLAAQGYRVFAGNLRGRPGCDGVDTGRAADWTLSDYLLRDLPALIGFLHEHTGERVHWVGHSMGGILGLSYVAHFGHAQVASVTTLGTALHYGLGANIFSHINRLRPALRLLQRIPYRMVQKLYAPLAVLGVPPSRMQVNRHNVSQETMAAIAGNVFVDLTMAELLELSSTFDGEGIRCHELDCLLPELAATLSVPWLSVMGAADLQCPPACADWTFERITSPRKVRLMAGKESGHRLDYGHFDLLCGRHADVEIWTPIHSFLESLAVESQ